MIVFIDLTPQPPLHEWRGGDCKKNLQINFYQGLILGLLLLIPSQVTSTDRFFPWKDAPPASRVMIYAPATPASLPLILAAEMLDDVDVKCFENHSQAHSLFLKGEAEMIATGLSVAVRLFRQGVPVKIVNSYVSGLTYLVTTKEMHPFRFRDLQGMTLCLPFPGSPIEEVTQFFVHQEGLDWDSAFQIKYVMFPGAVAMLRQGKIHAAVLPEPFVSQVIGYESKRNRTDIRIALSYRSLWEKYTGDPNGYPQVGTFVNDKWLFSDPSRADSVIRRLNQMVKSAIETIDKSPMSASEKGDEKMGWSPDILNSALRRMTFHFLENRDLKQAIQTYYSTLGKPLEVSFDPFFYTDKP